MIIKNIIFDFGGVLVDYNPERMINDNFPPEYHDIIADNVFDSTHWQDMDRGDISVDEAINAMNENIPEKFHSKVKEIVLEREKQMPPLHDMTPIIEALHKAGYRLFVLSNCPQWFYDFKKIIPGIELFSGFLVSSDIRITKPDERIYKYFLQKFSLKGEECLFIDDSPANIRSAEKSGINAYCFQDRDFNRLKKYISKITEA